MRETPPERYESGKDREGWTPCNQRLTYLDDRRENSNRNFQGYTTEVSNLMELTYKYWRGE